MNLMSYVENIELNDIIYSLASAKENIKTICINSNIKKYYQLFQNQNINFLDRILVNSADLYNLIIIYCIFHELWHFKQSKELTETPDTNRSILLKSSKIFAKYTFDTDYQMYHDKFYFEFDANIHAMIITLEYIKQLNLDEKALEILNSFFAKSILCSYDNYGLQEYENYYRYTLSPLEYFKFFLSENYLIRVNFQERIIISKLEKLLSTIDFLDTDGINNLISGYPISMEMIEKLMDVGYNKMNKIKNTDIMRELQTNYESTKKNKL